MHRSSTTFSISIGLASLTVFVLLATVSLGLLPDRAGALAEGRSAQCESIAVSCSLAAQRDDLKTTETYLRTIVGRNRDVRSTALRSADGELLVEVGDHRAHCHDTPITRSTLAHMQVPV